MNCNTLWTTLSFQSLCGITRLFLTAYFIAAYVKMEALLQWVMNYKRDMDVEKIQNAILIILIMRKLIWVDNRKFSIQNLEVLFVCVCLTRWGRQASLTCPRRDSSNKSLPRIQQPFASFLLNTQVSVRARKRCSSFSQAHITGHFI